MQSCGLALALTLPGCAFDGSGIGGTPTPDAQAMADAAPAVDAPPGGGDDGGCPLSATINFGGKTEPDVAGGPLAEVLVGDLITFTANVDCAGGAPVTYRWAIQPDDGISDTFLPDLASAVVSFYARKKQTYSISLQVTAGEAQAGDIELAQSHDWLVIDGLTPPEIRGLATGAGSLWIAGSGGAYRLPLVTHNGFVLLNDELTGDAIDDDLSEVLFDPSAPRLWFGKASDSDGVWRVDVGAGAPQSAKVLYNGADALNSSASVRDFVVEGSGVAVTTSKGITVATDGQTFIGLDKPDNKNPQALASGAGRRWSGANRLYDRDAGNQILDPFAGTTNTDSKIRTLAIDEAENELWAGSDDNGVARFNQQTDQSVNVFTVANSDLGSDRIRDLVVERTGPSAGDVWAATDQGVSRYLRSRGVWVHMNAEHGLSGHLDVRALAIDDEGGQRTIYAGTTTGLVYIRVP